MDWKEDIKARLIASIRKAFPDPTPLIGDKWFVFGEGGAAQAAKAAPPDFAFLGVRKLAKATGIPAHKVARLLVKNLDLSGLDARVAIEEEWKVHLWRLPPGSGVQNEVLPAHAPAGPGPASPSKDPAGPGPASPRGPAGPGPASPRGSAGPGGPGAE